MPVSGSVGFSDDTERKHQAFESFMRWHTRMAAGVIAAHGGHYIYADLTAGPGVYTGNGHTFYGSPLRALPLVSENFAYWHALLCEREELEWASLRRSVADLSARGAIDPVLVAVRHGDNRDIAPAWCRALGPKNYGVVFNDENGVPHFDLLAELSGLPQLHLTEFVIYLPATAVKWDRRVYQRATLLERLTTIKKRFWLIREPEGRWQWSFLVGTNWPKYPEWTKGGLHRLDSARGTAIFERLNLTEPSSGCRASRSSRT